MVDATQKQPAPAADSIAGLTSKPRTQRQRIWHTLVRNTTGMIGLLGILIMGVLVIGAPIFATHDPLEHNYSAVLQAPSSEHWFGTDEVGRDLFSRVLWGGQESLRVGLVGITIAMVGGVIMGLISGYYGGWVDEILMRLVDVWMAFPSFLLLLSIVAILGSGLGTLIIAIGVGAIPPFGRLVRASVLAAKNYDYVLAARAIGAPDFTIMFRHILPNVISILVVYASLGLGGFIIVGAGLSFLGLGAQPPSPEWGAMLDIGMDYQRRAWWMSVFPGVAILWAVWSVNLFGDGLRDAIDPRLQV